ncbi:aldehyde dehydrogenase family protein [Wohlfahrtiimonas chitiniclastica]|uniref:aldehyde dehydrogenase family protein n=1 Tax=Wohlfahrtiimonas chitiniclastica TaxID=400946 RepID=UPI001BCEE59E|nr:aldehyde dehydrogenase family protein [Wohlfahrtiimonas chitiniclastica]MBS7817427.1 aldehyde dehydrogenase family protein [Wohlfahrtiimonas chitiniclastica]MBS7823181.1 aldehyde dehydrogenase family protein [Wohlfahrtiimonas chitiniclastica]MBS7831070.1 aldehyde dehydrogenase family protein [Wohlfahrtiimonas chitiniclastica]MBS7833038.1 aldehyde dehydrogenase family protein [Wohlfahrtiimonas chitiniclastica]
MSHLQDYRKFYINGEWVNPKHANDFDVIDPSTEKSIAVISIGDKADTEAAIQAAKSAFPMWSATSPEDRLRYIEKILAIYERRAADMAQAITQEMGAPKDMSLSDQVGCGVAHIQAFIDTFKKFKFIHPISAEDTDTMVAWEPVGVVAAITPWNWPMNQITLKVIPALLAGNTVILKPSEIAPLSAIVWTEILDEAGLPKGVFNMLHGDGLGVGTQLSAHPDVSMISFTGSTRAGIAITKTAADTVKKVVLELGGKGANLVFSDADRSGIESTIQYCFLNSGQSCNAPTRLLVERACYDEIVDFAVKIANDTKVATAHQSGAHIGPVISKLQWEKIQDLIQVGINEGAKLVAGGTGLPEGLTEGYFVKPTVFADVNNDMRIAKEEIFGPVLSIIPFDTEEEAIAIANDTIYGLTNYIQTQDVDRKRRLARQLQAGMIEINGKNLPAGSAFGGVKASGRAREGGIWGLEEFMDSKFISGWTE